ncbi:catalase family protein [Caulobacter segnis]
MPFDPPATPLRFDPSVEELEKDEAQTTQGLIEQMRKIAEITYEDGGHAMRAVHAKSHGIVRGQVIVPADLPAVLAQGLFAQAGSHDVVMRFSTSPGDILDDSVSTPRGLAIKVFGVEGARLPGSDGASTQDFVLVNGKAFNAPKAKIFLANVKLLAATTDKAEGLKKVLSAALRGAESLVETLGGESATLKSLGGHPETHILGESFFSQAPIRFGDYIAKIGVRPITPALTALTDAPVDLKGKPYGLREAVSDHFGAHGGEWEVVVQLRTDAEAMPIEDSHKPWPEDKSPYVPVARLVVGPQSSWDEARTPKINDTLAFSPWHGLAAHQPLGSIMRVRKAVYAASQEFRLTRTGCPLHEPAAIADVS